MVKLYLTMMNIFNTLTFFTLMLLSTISFSQTIMFDDFNYSGITDPDFGSFNKWKVIDGVSGPPEGAMYDADNVQLIDDPNNPGGRLITLSTTVNGQTNATTQSRIETDGYEYFEGTYAARVYFSDTPHDFQDANIQTFYTIVSSSLGANGNLYSELDFEYMAADKWGTSPDENIMYLTSWNRYIPDPWQAWKRYFTDAKSYEGWHTLVVSATDGTNVKWWMDGVYFGSMQVTDNDGSSVYPRSNMHVAFANWVWNYVIGDSPDSRTTTMEVDWVLYQEDTELLPEDVENMVSNFRSQGITGRNLEGETRNTGIPTQMPFNGIKPIPGTIQPEDYDLGGQNIAFNETDMVNQGGEYRSDGVDIEQNGSGGYSLGYMEEGEWLEYTVQVNETDVYDIIASVANDGNNDGLFHLDIDGSPIGETGIAENSGGWYNWGNTTLGSAQLSEGEHILRLTVDQAPFNIDELIFTPQDITNSTKGVEFNQEINVSPNPFHSTINLVLPTHSSFNVSLYNTLGKTVFEKSNVQSGELQIPKELPHGIYNLFINCDIGNFQKSIMKF